MNLFSMILLTGILAASSGRFHRNETHPLNDDWLAETSAGRAVMTLETDSDGHFRAYTRRNADREILGFWTSTVARIFTANFKRGSLLSIEEGRLEEDAEGFNVEGIFASPLGRYRCKGTLSGDSLILSLYTGKGKIWNTVTATRGIPQIPLSDYPAILNLALQATDDNIYNRAVLEATDFRKFNRRMQRIAFRAQDDVEMVFAFYYHSGKLPFSHYALIKSHLDISQGIPPQDQPDYVIFEEKTPHIAYLRIKAFKGTAREIDSIFTIIKEKGYENLIIDLRSNSGGNIEPALMVARNIADTTYYGGIFLTQKWFDDHQVAPPIEEYVNFPHFSEANAGLLLDGIHEEEGICLKIEPEEETYGGKVFILTNRYTGSTCEPLVYGAKQYGLATIVGERTAGAMLNAEMFELTDGFQLFLPTAEYYASDGYRIDMKGVEPDIKVESGQALTYVLKNLTR